jgi:hypothetical protein
MVNSDVSRNLKWKEEIFIWIGRNPLKSPDSAKEMKAFFLGFIWISLHFLARTRPAQWTASARQ